MPTSSSTNRFIACRPLRSSSPSLPNCRVSRPAPRGNDKPIAGSSSAPRASSNDPPPMSATKSSPEDQPNHRRTARNVVRASSSPDKTATSTPLACCTFLSTARPLGASRMAEVAKATTVSAPSSWANSQASRTKKISESTPGRSIDPFASTCSARRNSSLCEAVATGAAP
ncbi:unannotated protein [freshwater metagenome]|uniref:Unannotated protein n=1 Tax=freshwater metagenome TaxID=449393 RepID=A0A6J6VQ18_9ZZZZ